MSKIALCNPWYGILDQYRALSSLTGGNGKRSRFAHAEMPAEEGIVYDDDDDSQPIGSVGTETLYFMRYPTHATYPLRHCYLNLSSRRQYWRKPPSGRPNVVILFYSKTQASTCSKRMNSALDAAKLESIKESITSYRWDHQQQKHNIRCCLRQANLTFPLY